MGSSSSLVEWVKKNYSEPISVLHDGFKIAYVVLVFALALFLGALKALVVGPVAGLILILGNIAVIIGLFPAHVAWTVYSLLKTNRINAALKLAFLFALPLLFSLWLALGTFGSVVAGVGYGVFTPWVSTFEAFRESSASKKFVHSIVDGTWGTIKGCCTVVRDFADFCYHSYPLYLKELRHSPADSQRHTIRFREIPACIIVGLMGLVVDVPLYTVIAVVKAPYMLFKGWQRLLQDLIGREGPFLETACIPVAGLAILLWPLLVIGSVLCAIVSSFFLGLYGSVIVYQERSLWRGVAYVIAIVAAFDEYTNDWLYLREGSFLPRPRYRRNKASNLNAEATGATANNEGKVGTRPMDPPCMLVPSLAPSRSVRGTIQEVKMVQIWDELMRTCETRGKELVDAKVVQSANLSEWLRWKGRSQELVGVGLPSYALLHTILDSIKAGAVGFMLPGGIEVTHLNRPKDRILDWFFHPVMVLKEQIRVIKLMDDELKFLERLVLFSGDKSKNGTLGDEFVVPQDPLRAAQIEAISRRLVGMTRSISKFPTYRRRYQHVIKNLIAYSFEKEAPALLSSIEMVHAFV